MEAHRSDPACDCDNCCAGFISAFDRIARLKSLVLRLNAAGPSYLTDEDDYWSWTNSINAMEDAVDFAVASNWRAAHESMRAVSSFVHEAIHMVDEHELVALRRAFELASHEAERSVAA